MKSEPPTPTRALDNQFRKLQDSYVDQIVLETPVLLNFWGWGWGIPIPSVMLRARGETPATRPRPLRRCRRQFPYGDLTKCSPTIYSVTNNMNVVFKQTSPIMSKLFAGRVCFHVSALRRPGATSLDTSKKKSTMPLEIS